LPACDDEPHRRIVDEHVAESRVVREYGLVDKAIKELESVLARFPDNLEARTELKEILKERQNKEGAAEQSLAIVQDPCSETRWQRSGPRHVRSLTPPLVPPGRRAGSTPTGHTSNTPPPIESRSRCLWSGHKGTLPASTVS
jgi:hypothetical protein